ncbi:expressed unknown protein [Seminavis robusta]|uniref:Uncharacterized protein n=1 Tax=Seminavis robusta TaxID=568900 RepID=A0A9N8DS93_9STRA|nr:expressed unknown protein [Seminavis robusta]|eukprot:Sro245_g097570.1 n/a (237) ;mRNA; f:76504-77312
MRSTFVLTLIITLLGVSQGQRFLRNTGQARAQVQAEMELDGVDLGGMSREMFLMKDKNWELLPPDLEGVSGSMKRHILKYFKDPVKLSLQKKTGKYGRRAIAKTEAGQKLRAYWRESPPGTIERFKPSELLDVPYDDAVRSRLSMVEFEVQLPPRPKSKKLPSVVYSVAIESGSMNPKCIVPRGAGRIRVYPEGRSGKPIDAGPGNFGLSIRSGLVDPGWARGRPAFRKGRPTGLI